jgi:hypothetical protein
MVFELKSLSQEAIPGALAKAERYRFLREPMQAESICRDIVATDPSNQEARILLLLCLTEQFDQGMNMQDTLDAWNAIRGDYERAYYLGLIYERRALALFRHTDFRSGQAIHTLILQAMESYEKAWALRPSGNDDSVLRWNSCARFLRRTPHLTPVKQAPEPAVFAE